MLRGNRVILRPVERADVPRLHELSRDVELSLLGDGSWSPRPLESLERRFNKYVEDQERAWFAIEADGRVIGDTGLHGTNRFTGTTEFGISIGDREYLGRGYGREAIALLIDWTFQIQNFRRIWLTTWATNERAIRCYRALGFVEEGRMRQQIWLGGAYVDEVLMGLLRTEWQALRDTNNGSGGSGYIAT